MPAEEGPPSQEVLAALVASLRQELIVAPGALAETRGQLAQARERIAELEAAEADAAEFFQAAVQRGPGQTAAAAAVAAEEDRPQAGRPDRA